MKEKSVYRQCLFAFLLGMLCLYFNQAAAQSANFRAQAKYYTAKEQFEKGDYVGCIENLKASRAYMSGKTNEQVQYLYVRAAYKAGRFNEAQRELALFYEITEEPRAGKREYFSKSVDRLTADEIREMTILLDKIDAEVANKTEEKAVAAAIERERAAIERERMRKIEQEEDAKRNRLRQCDKAKNDIDVAGDRWFDCNQYYPASGGAEAAAQYNGNYGVYGTCKRKWEKAEADAEARVEEWCD